MNKLSKENIKIAREKINNYIKNFKENKEIEATRSRALTLIGTIFGEKSNEYKRFRDIGFASWTDGGYTANDAQSFIHHLEGVLDTLDVFDV